MNLFWTVASPCEGYAPKCSSQRKNGPIHRKKPSASECETVNEGWDQFEEKVCRAFAALSCFVTDFVWEFEVIGAGLWALTRSSHPVQYGTSSLFELFSFSRWLSHFLVKTSGRSCDILCIAHCDFLVCLKVCIAFVTLPFSITDLLLLASLASHLIPSFPSPPPPVTPSTPPLPPTTYLPSGAQST